MILRIEQWYKSAAGLPNCNILLLELFSSSSDFFSPCSILPGRNNCSEVPFPRVQKLGEVLTKILFHLTKAFKTELNNYSLSFQMT